MPQYTQAKLDETIELFRTQGYKIELSSRQGQQLVKIFSKIEPISEVYVDEEGTLHQLVTFSSDTQPKLDIYFNAEEGTLRVIGANWPTGVYTRIHAALSNLTFEFEHVPLTDGRTSFWFYSDDDAQRDELLRMVKAILAIAGVAMPQPNAVA